MRVRICRLLLSTSGYKIDVSMQFGVLIALSHGGGA